MVARAARAVTESNGGAWPGNRVSARPGCQHGDFKPEIPCPLKLDNLLDIQIVSEYDLLSKHKWTRI